MLYAIIFEIVSTVLPLVVIYFIVKAYKKNKTDKAKLKDEENKPNDGYVVGGKGVDDKTFCDYCGATVNIKDKRCKNCKAKLNNDKK